MNLSSIHREMPIETECGDAPERMRAAWYRRLGPARDVLEVGDLPVPQPGAGELRVRIVSSGVNPSDVKNRAGQVFTEMPFERIVPHSDGAGVVDAVGAGVERSRVGQRVWLWNAQFRRPRGTAAQWCVVPQFQAVPMPPELSFDEATCLGIPALTAWRAVNLDAAAAGEWVLVSGGSGVVGHYAVQLARLRGARVIATAGTTDSMAHARSAGAEHVLDYRSVNLEEEVRELTGGEGVARVIEVEFGLNQHRLPGLLRQEGVVYVYGSAGSMTPQLNVQQLMLRGVSLHFRSVYLMPAAQRQAAIADLDAMIRNKQLRHAVGRVYGIEDIADAHEAVENRTATGNIVVRF